MPSSSDTSPVHPLNIPSEGYGSDICENGACWWSSTTEPHSSEWVQRANSHRGRMLTFFIMGRLCLRSSASNSITGPGSTRSREISSCNYKPFGLRKHRISSSGREIATADFTVGQVREKICALAHQLRAASGWVSRGIVVVVHAVWSLEARGVENRNVKEGDEAGRCLFIGCAGGNETIIPKHVPLEDKGVIKVPNAHIEIIRAANVAQNL